LRSKMLSWETAITPNRQPVAPKYLENEYTAITLCGTVAINEQKPSTKVP